MYSSLHIWQIIYVKNQLPKVTTQLDYTVDIELPSNAGDSENEYVAQRCRENVWQDKILRYRSPYIYYPVLYL